MNLKVKELKFLRLFLFLKLKQMMKYIMTDMKKLLILVFAALCFTACGNDDEPEATPTITKTAKSSTAVRLYWKSVTGTGYKVQKYNASTKQWVTVKTIAYGTNNYKIANLKRNTSYTFRVVAYRYDGKKNVLSTPSKITVKTKA